LVLFLTGFGFASVILADIAPCPDTLALFDGSSAGLPSFSDCGPPLPSLPLFDALAVVLVVVFVVVLLFLLVTARSYEWDVILLCLISTAFFVIISTLLSFPFSLLSSLDFPSF
jgi:hypothetical protein